jgi:hypothetical protein
MSDSAAAAAAAAAPTESRIVDVIEMPKPTEEASHEKKAATAPPPASAAAPLDDKAAEEARAKAEAEENKLAEAFARERMRFLIKDLATEAAVRAISLLETNTAMRVLVNSHFMREREVHARQDARDSRRAAELKQHDPALAKNNGKSKHAKKQQESSAASTTAAAAADGATESQPTASAAAPGQRRVFSRPLILYTMQQADGSWLTTRILNIDPAVPAANLTQEQLVDLDLAGQMVLQTASHYASVGFEGFALVVDALERTERQMVCRHVTYARIAHKTGIESMLKIKDAERRLKALAEVTKLIPIFASIRVEDLEGKKILVFRERARLAEECAPVDTPIDERRVSTAFQPGDSRELLELKRDKQLLELDAQRVLDELRRDSLSFQNYALSRSSITLLIAALRAKPAILDHIELQIKSGKREPTLVSFMVKACAIDTSDLPISYASADQLRERLKQAVAEGNKSDIERVQKILDKVVEEAKRLSSTTFDPATKQPLPVGADCVVFEMINQCTGLAMPFNTTHLGTFPDVMTLRSRLSGANELEKNMLERRTTVAREAAAEQHQFDFTDDDMKGEIAELVKDLRRRSKMSNEEWARKKDEILKSVEAAMAKADAPEEVAADGGASEQSDATEN